ncbi:MAG: hypothetical protein U0441_07020 [Polyangiaceae bacterium]
MKLSTIQDMLETLDRSYDIIAAEASESGASVPAWESIVRGRPLRSAGTATGDLQCAAHMAPHGLAHDALSDHLATEIAAWTALAERSQAARYVLGIERIAPRAGARLGVMLHADRDLELRLGLSTSGGTVVPTEEGRALWTQTAPESIGFRRGAAATEAYLMFSNDGKGRRWSFSEVRKGYEDYLHSIGKRVEEAALDELGSCPTPRLLGMITEHNRRESAERAAIALSEALLADGDGGGKAGDLVGSCPACRFGLGAWLCGHAEVLARGAVANLDYAKMQRLWLSRLRDRRAPGPRAGMDSDAPPPMVGIPAAASRSAPPVSMVSSVSRPVSGPPGSRPLSVPPASGQESAPRSGPHSAPRSGPHSAPRSGPPRKERVRARLATGAFPCDKVEIQSLVGKEQLGAGTFQVEVVCFDEDGLDVARVLGAPVSVVLEEARGAQGSAASAWAPAGEVRRVTGTVSEVAEVLNTESAWSAYRLWIETNGADADARQGTVTLPLRARGEASDVYELEARSRRTLGPGDEDRTYLGKSDRGQIAPGATLTLTGHPRMAGVPLFVVSVEHRGVWTVRGSQRAEEPYHNVFRGVDADRDARTIRAPGRGSGFDG